MTGLLWLGLGLVILVKGAELLVTGATTLAQRLKVSEMIIGLTIVSFGTSAPELVVNLFASFSGNTQIAIGNILGSNVANLLLILGFTALVYPLHIGKNTIITEIPFSLIAILLVGFLANTALFSTSMLLELNRSDGLIILFFFFLYLLYILDVARLEQGEKNTPSGQQVQRSTSKSVAWIIVGLLGLFLGGKWVVDGAVILAKFWGLSEAFIGLTIIAVGTSLPELVTSVLAAYRRNTDLAVGNVVGSNIFNILWILGISATIHPLPFLVASNLDILMIVVATVMVIITLLVSNNKIGRWAGAIFILAYILYSIFLYQRG